jgi:hypothetical protein
MGRGKSNIAATGGGTPSKDALEAEGKSRRSKGKGEGRKAALGKGKEALQESQSQEYSSRGMKLMNEVTQKLTNDNKQAGGAASGTPGVRKNSEKATVEAKTLKKQLWKNSEKAAALGKGKVNTTGDKNQGKSKAEKEKAEAEKYKNQGKSKAEHEKQEAEREKGDEGK